MCGTKNCATCTQWNTVLERVKLRLTFRLFFELITHGNSYVYTYVHFKCISTYTKPKI